MQVVQLKCQRPECGKTTLIPPSTLQGISDYREYTSRDDRYVDFVCPECGFGKRRYYTKQEIPTPRDLDIVHPSRALLPQDLCVVFLKCEKEGCEASAKVHTLRESEAASDRPKKEVDAWTLDEVRCKFGHLAKAPPEERPDYLMIDEKT